MDLIASLPNLSYLSLELEHRGSGTSRLPIEAMFAVLERKPYLETLNLRFTEVDVQLEHLYVPACLRFRIHGLHSLRLKALPNLLHLYIEYFDLPPVQLTAYIEMITATASLRELALVDLEESCDTITHLPNRFHGTLERLTLDLDGSSLDLRALISYRALKHLQLGFTPFRATDFKFLPKSLKTLQFHPGTLEQVLHLTAYLANTTFLPDLRAITLCGSYEAFWYGDDSREDDWQLAKEIVAQFLVVVACRKIDVHPEGLLEQLEERRWRWQCKTRSVYAAFSGGSATYEYVQDDGRHRMPGIFRFR